MAICTGRWSFIEAAKKQDINPIIGYEAYIAAGSRKKKGAGTRDSSYHLTLLCQNATGFRNLVKMASQASLEGFYFKPRIDKELLEATQRRDHLLERLCLQRVQPGDSASGGNGAEDHLARSEEVAQWFHGVFGDRYFIEIMNNGR